MTTTEDLADAGSLTYHRSQLALNSKDVIPLSRYEMLHYLEEIKRALHLFKGSSKKTEKLTRLSCKLRYRLAKDASIVFCSCRTLSEGCAGIVRGAPYTSEQVYCSFTKRGVTPVLFQTFEVKPLYLALKEELIDEVISKRRCDDPVITKRPLTYAIITETHLPAIKCLIENFFWRPVDVSSVVDYQEFSCVVLYGKVVVGFGYISPGTHKNEGYVNFLFVRPEWRNCGIGQTIMFLLRQKCMHWSLTLHVSPRSEALSLYHKFGFKAMCRIRNFYTGYVFSHSGSDRDAIFMKLDPHSPSCL
ncbi:Acetyltransferase (GNAT) family [Nesidiocoris tenuis]|uniref:Acetyltransferase (GNAT) family n=1 Tax=Nesidiocoris tenuis TaxID=355587 RepID=A0ABN7BIF8_9HEMI|nr:Acetyltransferase (GNAT) family [Nesidiocoris tenuis]